MYRNILQNYIFNDFKYSFKVIKTLLMVRNIKYISRLVKLQNTYKIT